MKNARYLPLLLILSLLLAPPAQAQVTIGAFGDLNRAGVSGDAPDDFSYAGNSGFGRRVAERATDDPAEGCDSPAGGG